MKKILVTGCNGFIGRHVSFHFASSGYTVCGIDVAETPDSILSRFIQGKICDDALVELGEPFDVIIHLAGPGTVSAANQDAEGIRNRVMENLRVVLESTRRYPETLLLFPSSAAVYGNQSDTFLSETNPLMPISNYGRNKVAEERLCEEYHCNYGSKIGVIRFFSIYGPGLRKQVLWDFSRRFADTMKDGRDFVPCFGSGEETRDYLYIDDVVQIFRLFCRENPNWLVVNAGTGIAYSIRQVLSELVSSYGYPVKLRFDGIIRPDNPTHLIADCRQLKSFGFVPSVSFDEGIKRYASWAAKELLIEKMKR